MLLEATSHICLLSLRAKPACCHCERSEAISRLVQTRLLRRLRSYAVSAWAANWGMCGVLSVDGKYLRGSKREGLQALQVVTAVAQQMGIVLCQTEAEGDELEAAIALLEQLPLEGQIVSLDAGLLQLRLVETAVKFGFSLYPRWMASSVCSS